MSTYVRYAVALNELWMQHRVEPTVLVKVQVFRNDGAEIDVAPGPGKAYTRWVNLRDPDLYDLNTIGDEATYAYVSFDIKVVRVGKANTLLVVPNDWSTLSNGTVDKLTRLVGEALGLIDIAMSLTSFVADLVDFRVSLGL